MRKKRVSVIQKQYRYDKETNSYLIEVSLDDYDDVYNQWDPAPFRKRDIEEEFNEFITASAEDIPSKYGLIVSLYLPINKKDENKEQALISAYRNFYAYETEKEKRNWTNLKKKTSYYFILSMLFLLIGYFFMLDIENIIISVAREGIFIGGWVFLWEVITNIFIVRREMKQSSLLFQRLLQAEIRFIYR
ncbi:MAG: hypothetical protein GX288_08390 [Clostridiales bacterium]|nr:hypothetical protein [Clostridiales bacterium]